MHTFSAAQRGCRAALAAIALIVLIVLAGCGGGDVDTEATRLGVVATTSMIADAAARVGGPDADVVGLMGPGIDPHLYKAGEGDVRRLQQADLILYNGLHLESRMGEVLERMASRRPTAAVAEAVAPEALIELPGDRGEHDPHVWFDLELWSAAVVRIGDAMADADPDHADGYRSRAGELAAELAQLDAGIERAAASVPQSQRVLVTAHDAFAYFGRAYGFEVRGLQGVSTSAEAGARDVQELATFIAERGLPAIFVESSVSPRAIEAVQAAVRARGAEVRLGGELFSDALGTAGTPEGTFVGTVRHNVRTIVGALGGDPSTVAGGGHE